MAPTSSSASSTSSQSVNIAKPAAGETLAVTSVPGGSLSFAFDPATASVSRSGNDLVFALDDGGTVRLTDFFVVGDQSLPSLTLPGGETVASADFLSAFDVNLETAAGPGAGAGAPGSGAGEYADDAGALIDGVSRLGSLGTDQWGYDSEVPEVYSGLLADAGGGAAGGLPGVPGDTPPPVVTEDTLHAHPGTEGISASGTFNRETKVIPEHAGDKTNVTDADEITGKLKDNHHSPVTGKDHYGVTSSSGDIDVLSKALGFDFEAYTKDQGISWSTNGSSVGAAQSDIIETGTSLTADWSMIPGSNSGSMGDFTIAILYQMVDGKMVEAGRSKIFTYDDPNAVKACSFTWTGLTPGEYVIVYVVAETDNNNGNKTILDFGTATPTIPAEITHEDTYTFTLAAAGNVITDIDPDPDATDGQTMDHHSSLSQDQISVIGISCEFLNNGEPITLENGTYTGTGVFNDHTFTFTINADGSYTFHMEGEGKAPSLDDLNITYTIQTPDGLEDSASLTLKPDYTVFDESNVEDGKLVGSDGNDIIYGSDDGDLIYAGLGDDTIYGGKGADTFAWGPDDYDNGTDRIMDFDMAEDKLLFEGFFGPQDDLSTMLADGIIGLTALSDHQLELTLQHGGLTQTIEINLTDSLSEAEAAQVGGDAADQAAFLQQILANYGG